MPVQGAALPGSYQNLRQRALSPIVLSTPGPNTVGARDNIRTTLKSLSGRSAIGGTARRLLRLRRRSRPPPALNKSSSQIKFCLVQGSLRLALSFEAGDSTKIESQVTAACKRRISNEEILSLHVIATLGMRTVRDTHRRLIVLVYLRWSSRFWSEPQGSGSADDAPTISARTSITFSSVGMS